MSADDGIHVKETSEGFEVRHWMGEDSGRLLGIFPSIDLAIKRGQEEGTTEYGFSFTFHEISTTDELEVDIPGRGKTKCHALFVSPLLNVHYGDSIPFDLKIDGKPLDLPNVAYVIVTPA